MSVLEIRTKTNSLMDVSNEFSGSWQFWICALYLLPIAQLNPQLDIRLDDANLLFDDESIDYPHVHGRQRNRHENLPGGQTQDILIVKTPISVSEEILHCHIQEQFQFIP